MADQHTYAGTIAGYEKRGRLQTFFRRLRRDKYMYYLAIPGLLFFLIFKYIPITGVVIAFQDYSPIAGVWNSPWVGFQHFQRFFSDPQFWILFRNTMMINILSLVFFFPLPILLSLLMNELKNEVFKRIIQSVVYLPHFLSWVIIAGLTFMLLSVSRGFVNEVLMALGMAKIQFLNDPHLLWIILTVQTIWKETGWGTIIFLAAIAGTDPQLYEAARMDGAGKARQMWHVTLPSIRNVIFILLILRLGHMMDIGFEQVYLMYNGAVSNVAEVFDTYVYRLGVQQGQFSFSTAVGLFKSVIGLTLVIAANKLAKKFGEEGVY
ncbi:ABC transporter permease [Paenibacillus sepulcri]|uniref:Sugar ABC transporter permease n=1 Tax=Paenibacillus sepulcri TaxID=359917 RepID=A0ABS7BZF6_9BACL|nr:sugar ABC transporter permease [Paenibacillus sepulcri]